ncbi:hypothetical protein [Streptomyces sp. NPDC055085]
MTDSDASPGNGEPAAASSDGAEFLAICLNDHLTGASTGTELLDRAVRARAGHDGEQPWPNLLSRSSRTASR